MRAYAANAAFGALDYIAYPAGMLLLAPVILRALGIDRFGIWALDNAVLMIGAILASGFGDANIRAVAQARARRDSEELIVTVRSAFGIHLVLGVLVASAVWLAAPALTHPAVKMREELAGDCLWSLRITAGLILLRALETVCVSTQRAFNRYGTAIEVSASARVVSLFLAWLVPGFDKSVTAVLAATLATNALALCIQLCQLKRLLGAARITPVLRAAAARGLLGFGVFTWLQAAAGLLVGQVDRLVAGVALGASAVAIYAICVQLAQPIYGITAAGLHFLFPLLASDSAHGSHRALRRSIAAAFAANFTFVALALAVLLLFGRMILAHWMGASVAGAAASVLPIAACGSALAALSVTGSYALLAMGRPRAVAILNIVGGLAMAGALVLLIPRFGLAGVAFSRLLPGCVALLVYIPLASRRMQRSAQPDSASRLPLFADARGQGASCTVSYDTVPKALANDSPRQCANVLGVSIDAVDMERALAMIGARLRHGPKGYVCAVDVRGVLEAIRHQAVADAYAHATLALPDGTPTVWVGRAQGFHAMDHVTGPGVMQEIFRRAEFAGYSHFFYGGNPGVADELAATLCRQFPWTKIAGTYTPPFRELAPAEEEELVADIRRRQPDIVWVGISTPQQDLWMRRMLPRLDTRMMFGVGAAFDFLTGHIRLCPAWMKRAGLHWLHRLAQDPARLWRRNVRNTAFLWHIALQLTGVRNYSMRADEQLAGCPAFDRD